MAENDDLISKILKEDSIGGVDVNPIECDVNDLLNPSDEGPSHPRTIFFLNDPELNSNKKTQLYNLTQLDIDQKRYMILYKAYRNMPQSLSGVMKYNQLVKSKLYTNTNLIWKLLDKDKIVGYLELKDKPILTFTKNGINQTILKYVVDEISDINSVITNMSNPVIASNYKIDYQNIYKEISNMVSNNNIKINNTASSNLDFMVIEFYTLIAMTCLYSGILAMVSINKCLPNISDKGKRMAVSPTKKSTLVLSSLLAAFIVQLIGLALLFLYTIFVINVDFGDKPLLVVLVSIIGTLTGLALGLAVGVNLKSNENTKTGIIIAISMTCCFFAGMMGVTMKYIIDKNIPLLNKLNPGSLITDALYSIYYFDSPNRYIMDLLILLGITVVLIILSFNSLRRQRYDSI